MRNSLSRGSYRVKILYSTSCSKNSLLHAAYAVASALFLSNSIRNWVDLSLVIRAPIGGSCRTYLVEIHGGEVRWLRPGERNLLGFLRTVINGRGWPGVRLTIHDNSSDLPHDCVRIHDYLSDVRSCPGCIGIDEDEAHFGLKPWWLLASVMVVNDAQCRGGCS